MTSAQTPNPRGHCHWQRGWGRLVSLLVAGGLLFLTLSWAPAAFSQLSLPGLDTSSYPLPYSVRRVGLLEVTDIQLDGKTLFEIASPSVSNRNEPGDQIPVEVRAQQIESHLQQLVSLQPNQVPGSAELPDPDTLQVSIDTINNQPVLFANHAALVRPQALVTVTDTDARFHALPKQQLAEDWQVILQEELRQAIDSRQPEVRQRRQTLAVAALGGTIVITLLLMGLRSWLGRRQKRLEQQHQTQATTPSQQEFERSEQYRQDWLENLKAGIGLQRRIQFIYFLQWLVFWVIVFAWLGGMGAILYQFPGTRQLAVDFVSTPALVLAAWFIAGLINRLANLSIDRFAKSWQINEPLAMDSFQRLTLRISTISNVLKGLKKVLIYAIALITVLQILGIAPVSILALGAIVALAASFAAQNLVKDMVNGFLILLEDQYAIGDYVGINGVMGMVEDLNLRITQIRSNEGNLITIPNSQILQAENMSRQWARCDYVIEVAYDTDIDQAIAIVQAVAEALGRDPEWGKLILDPVELLGVDHISHAGIKLRIWIRTLPLKQWMLAREFRRRLKIAFDQQGIHIGIPQQSLSGHLRGSLNGDSLN